MANHPNGCRSLTMAFPSPKTPVAIELATEPFYVAHLPVPVLVEENHARRVARMSARGGWLRLADGGSPWGKIGQLDRFFVLRQNARLREIFRRPDPLGGA